MSSLTTPTAGKTVHCRDCTKEFEGDPNALGWFVCPDCQKERERNQAEREQERKERIADLAIINWESRCPVLFQKTEIAKLPNQASANDALQWKYGPRGILLHGETGSGKSRTAWEILKREHMQGKTWKVINSSSALEYAAIFGRSPDAMDAWLDSRCKCQVLLMDDAFKVKLTESYEAAIFAIIDRRMENCLPIIATMNDVGETLKSRLSGDRADPLIRRLRECCTPIAF